jgi:iron complex transport system substrate-binding protein
VVAVEWLDPPFAVGHWVPEQIRRAGGWDLLGSDGEKAQPTTWDAVAEVDPEMLFLMPCGFHLAETIDEWSRTPVPPGIGELAAARSGAVFALDGSAYFSRPGPRVIDGVEMLAEIMDPEAFVVRHGPRDPLCRRSRGLGPALPGLHRQRRRQRVPPLPASPGAPRAGGRNARRR